VSGGPSAFRNDASNTEQKHPNPRPPSTRLVEAGPPGRREYPDDRNTYAGIKFRPILQTKENVARLEMF
jgi:hypothetical protein